MPSAGLIGGGSRNDGVFANMMAKPELRSRRTTANDDSIYLAPEDAQKDAPPSYTAAQADSVPPYWETTVHLSSSSSNPSAGEMIIDGIPTGILFSFLWNMLVSVSFQFVGFLLTFLLHTTHAAKLGSRAGLGVTLIQYGFALRSKPDTADGAADPWGWGGGPPVPSPPFFETYAEAEEWYKNNTNITLENPSNSTIVEGSIEVIPMSDATSEWLSFLLMTIGWFILLTSLLSFWRVKRWERSILNSSAREPSTPPPQDETQQAAVLARLNRTFGLSTITSRSFFTPRRTEPDPEAAREMDVVDPESQARFAEVMAHDARLQSDLRSAGLL